MIRRAAVSTGSARARHSWVLLLFMADSPRRSPPEAEPRQRNPKPRRWRPSRHGTPPRRIPAGHAGRDHRAVGRGARAPADVGTTDLDKSRRTSSSISYGTLTGNNSAAQVFIRGIGQTDATPAVDPGVGIYIDDVYMGRVGGRRHGFSRHRQRADPARTAGNAVRTQYHRRRRAADHQRAGRSTPAIRCASAWAKTTCTKRLVLRLPLGDDLVGAHRAGGCASATATSSACSTARISATRRCTPGQLGIRWKPSDASHLTLRGDYTKEDENGSPFVFQSP